MTVGLPLQYRSEVDPKGSLWYTVFSVMTSRPLVLKLTPKGHYGIPSGEIDCWTMLFWSWPQRVIMVYGAAITRRTTAWFWSWPQRVIMVYYFLAMTLDEISSEVDPKGSLWYTSRAYRQQRDYVLKLTPKGHYGIRAGWISHSEYQFWSWPQRVIMVYILYHTTNTSLRSEVDPKGSLWYKQKRTCLRSPWFWSWPQRVIMV